MQYCKRCVMPDTRPGITFNENGVCSACINYEKRNQINYSERWKELERICDKYRGMNGTGYDCAIAVSGGKDSHYQVYVMKELLHMNPVLFSVEDNFPMTEAGKHNLQNIAEEFGCQIVSLKPNRKLQKRLMRKTFEKYEKPTWLIGRLIYTYPLHMSLKSNTPLLVYGENVSYEYGGTDGDETYSAREILKNGVASDIPLEELLDDEVSKKDLYMTIAPSREDLDRLDPIYLSYFVEWNSYLNYIFAKSRGFHDLTGEWNRTMTVESFDQVDSAAYLVHAWMKYPKYGHALATDYCSRLIRYGIITREQAVALVREKDGALDPRCVREFCEFCGYRESEFWRIVDSWYDKNIFSKSRSGMWTLKE